MKGLSVGNKAPDFTLTNQYHQPVTLSQYEGQSHVILYFYPKDETPGCVKEACAFRDAYEVFKERGAEVIGISADTVSSHLLFCENRKLPFQLLSDPDNQVSKNYGVKSTLFGLLPGRYTFVIDKSRVIRNVFSSQLAINRHVQDALTILDSLS